MQMVVLGVGLPPPAGTDSKNFYITTRVIQQQTKLCIQIPSAITLLTYENY